MKIDISPMIACIDRMMHYSEVTKPQQAALNHIAEIAHHAQNSAYARPPQPTFTHCESISSALVEELSEQQLKELTPLGITLSQNIGMPYHMVRMTFHP